MCLTQHPADATSAAQILKTVLEMVAPLMQVLNSKIVYDDEKLLILIIKLSECQRSGSNK